ncbi:PREDICTED: uncharacterized protein LOC105502606 [Colobus angolensis palliatus]|uniref:uncharacterized protein LOC105502606 n=1 Tax=Colobus angolensis palliatus TaxID=336983 RepID=UPI0005F45D87|nr:PREDICTED: uncharacterized protein LOC105502606 [Colobus angolensis palliatus]
MGKSSLVSTEPSNGHPVLQTRANFPAGEFKGTHCWPQFALSSVFPPARNQCSFLVVWPRSFAVPRYLTPSHTIATRRTSSLEICRHLDSSRAVCQVSAAARRQGAGPCGLCCSSEGFAPASAPSCSTLITAPPRDVHCPRGDNDPGVSHDCCPMCVRGVLWESMDSEVPGLSADLCPVGPVFPGDVSSRRG